MTNIFSITFNTVFGLSILGTVISLAFFLLPKNIFLRALKYNLFLIAIVYTISMVTRSVQGSYIPMAGLFESLFFFGWSLCIMSLFVYLRFKEDFFLPLSFPVLFLILLKAVYSPWKINPLPPALKTYWFEIHVSTSFFAYGAFAIAFACGVFYLLKNFLYYSGSLPELNKIDLIIYRSSVWGLFLFSASMFSGGIWAYLAWCNYFIWTPKEIWSVLLWMFYAFYLHARLLKEWPGKRCAWLAIIGFILTVFTYLGVSLLMKSSHSL